MKRPAVRRKRNKFRAQPTNGFASRLESDVADKLARELGAGESLITQVPIQFACGAKYIVDFGIVNDATGEIVRYVEAKGQPLPVWRLKMRLLKYEFPLIYSRLTVIYGKDMPKRKRALR